MFCFNYISISISRLPCFNDKLAMALDVKMKALIPSCKLNGAYERI